MYPWHYHTTNDIINSGFLDIKAQHYYFYPLYHIIHAITSLLIGFSKPLLFETFNLLTSLISVILVYVIGKELFGDKTGLISALLYSILSATIFLTVFNTSKIGGTVLFLTCLFLILKKNKSNNYKIGILFLIAATALMLWHPEISIALILVLGADVVSQLITKKRIDFLSAFLFFLLIFLSYLIYVDIQLFINIVDSIFIDSSGPAMLNEMVQEVCH